MEEGGGYGPVGMITAPVSAALGRGPWEDISNFLGGLTGRDRERTKKEINNAANVINRVAPELDIKVGGKANVEMSNKVREFAIKFLIAGVPLTDDIVRQALQSSGADTARVRKQISQGEIPPEARFPELAKFLKDPRGEVTEANLLPSFTGRAKALALSAARSIKNRPLSPGRAGALELGAMSGRVPKQVAIDSLFRELTRVGDIVVSGGDPSIGGSTLTSPYPNITLPTEPGLITEPPTETPTETPTESPTETPTEPSDQGLFEFTPGNIEKLFASEPVSTALESAQATQADADATPSDKNNAWGKVAFGLAAGAGLFGLSKLFQPRNGETTDGDINNLPRLNLNLPSSNRLGLNFSNTGGLTPVPPPALATLPTGVQSVRGIVPEFKYKDDYVGYPLL